jgi:hypothetical protein
VSIVTIAEPTRTVVPSGARISVTVPAHLAGISTIALAVSTSTIGWLSATVSPTATSHLTISPSVSPSPRSGSKKCFTPDTGSPPADQVDGVEDPI